MTWGAHGGALARRAPQLSRRVFGECNGFFLTYPAFPWRSVAGRSRSFATPRATPTEPSCTGTVIGEKAGHRHPQLVGDGPKSIYGDSRLAVFDALESAALHACLVGEGPLRKLATLTENANAITEFSPAAERSLVGGIGLRHPTYTEWILEPCMQRRSVNLPIKDRVSGTPISDTIARMFEL